MFANAKLEYVQKPNPEEIDTLVFSGAGAVGIAYSGVFEALDILGILPNIKTVAGSSAGSIIALVLALGYDVDEIKKTINNTKFAEFLDNPVVDINKVIKDPSILKERLDWAAVLAMYIFGEFAMCPGIFAKEFLEKLITAPVKNRKITFDADITFGELYKYTECELIVTVCNIGSGVERYVSYKTYPNIKVIDAVYASMAIPFVFRPIDVFGQGTKCCVDGGTVSNTPIEAVKDKNWLGFVCETKPSYIDPAYSPIETIFDYLPGLVRTLRNTKTQEIIEDQELLDRLVFIDPLNIGVLDFDMSEQQIKDLIKSGKDAVIQYFPMPK